MKIQCDVCNKEEASVFCAADEAALCDDCDRRVHRANKLAFKHRRFSLLQANAEQFPLCDICKVKRAFLFCQQDRAILCRDCDLPIHAANEYTKRHNRFLFTGVKLSAVSDFVWPESSSAAEECDSIPKHSKPKPPIRNPFSPAPEISFPSSIEKSSVMRTLNKDGVTTKSIPEHENLSGILPSWNVEDLLESSSAPFYFNKADGDGVLPFLQTDFENYPNSLSPENMSIFVPQASGPPQASQYLCWSDDDLTVPQINPQSAGQKESGNFWWQNACL